MSTSGLQLLPERYASIEQALSLISQTLNSVIKGRANVIGSLTLDAGVASTVIIDPDFESPMVPVLLPTTANAAAALATTYLTARDKGSFTLAHANNAQIDRTFLYIHWGIGN